MRSTVIENPPGGRRDLDDAEHLEAIRVVRARWRREVLLLAHHYQRPEIVAEADRVGDSYELSRAASEERDARFIVFCGVRFMAEAAEILRQPHQRVIHPAPEAGCPMADMASVEDAQAAWEALCAARGPEAVMPVVYMNSSAALKALVARHGGCVCTSSNAGRAFRWALAKREALLFFPDEHLGRNTARELKLPGEELVVWNPREPDGGVPAAVLRRARVILWKGFCHVHTTFRVSDVDLARERHPGARVLVHPECPADVVQRADGSGSTSYLVRAVKEAPRGSVLVIGTEINLVTRLAHEHPDRQVLPLGPSLCHNMFRISPRRVREALESLSVAEAVELPAEIKEQARAGLERMLTL
jgi:quinolinate synthase